MGIQEDKIHKRINRIIGQLKGIDAMVQNKRACKDVLLQINAAKAAVNNMGLEIAKSELCDITPEYAHKVAAVLKEVSRL